MNNKDFEPIRVRIMQEAYELADRNDSEGYNAIKVMCGDVQKMLPPQRPIDFGPQPDMHYGMNQDDWKDIVAAISKARDSRGIYLACRPADVFQDWFLAMGLFKPKEKANET